MLLHLFHPRYFAVSLALQVFIEIGHVSSSIFLNSQLHVLRGINIAFSH